MNFNFILDENYLALFILQKRMFNESKEVENIKSLFCSNNDIGYKKILEEHILDLGIYLKDENINILIEEFISTNIFNEIYKAYSSESKHVVAIKLLKNIINIDDNNLEKTKDELWLRYKDGYWNLLNMNVFNPSIFLLDNDVKKTIQKLKETDEFKRLYNETKVYLDNVKRYWESKKNIVNTYLNKVLKMDINLIINVYISHPNTCTGFSFGNNNAAWGHYKGLEDPNYNLIYLVHEALHSLLPFDKDETEIQSYIKHTIIELISDYELYSLLKGESALNEGHSYLDEYKIFIYPYWLMYIGLDKLQIKERLKMDSIKPTELIEVGNIDISKLNIQQFIEFCEKKYCLSIGNSSEKKITK